MFKIIKMSLESFAFNAVGLMTGVNLAAKYGYIQPDAKIYWMVYDFMRPSLDTGDEEKQKARRKEIEDAFATRIDEA